MAFNGIASAKPYKSLTPVRRAFKGADPHYIPTLSLDANNGDPVACVSRICGIVPSRKAHSLPASKQGRNEPVRAVGNG
jgi:hypothetical protein